MGYFDRPSFRISGQPMQAFRVRHEAGTVDTHTRRGEIIRAKVAGVLVVREAETILDGTQLVTDVENFTLRAAYEAEPERPKE